MQFNTFGEAARVANAAGRDAGNRSIHTAGRTLWNEDDREAACQTSDAVMDALGFGHDRYSKHHSSADSASSPKSVE